NNTILVNGEDAWNMQADMMHAIVTRVDSYPSVMGYEILNEPHIYDTSQYAKLGHMQTFIAQKIRALSSKIIVFDKTEPHFTNMKYIDLTHDPLTKPAGVSNIVFGPHAYNFGRTPGLPSVDVPGYKQLA